MFSLDFFSYKKSRRDDLLILQKDVIKRAPYLQAANRKNKSTNNELRRSDLLISEF